MYGSIKVVYKDDTEKTYDTYIGHLVKYEQEFGGFAESVTAAAKLAWIVSDTDRPFDEWVGGVKYVEPVLDRTELPEVENTADGGEDVEPVPTQ